MKNSDKKPYAPINNFAALKEVEEKYYTSTTEKELERFLEFWQWSYDIWRESNSPYSDIITQEKVKSRKALIKTLGFYNE